MNTKYSANESTYCECEESLKEKLDAIYNDTDNDLKKTVINTIIDERGAEDNEDVEMFFKDLSYGGCQSGFIGSLCSYTATRSFYNKFYHEIEELRIDIEDSLGEPINVGDKDYKNTMAWFAFEETAYRLSNELEI